MTETPAPTIGEGDPHFDLTGRVAVVTGGLGQLGQQFAQTLLHRGVRVMVWDIAEANAPFQALQDKFPEALRLHRVEITDRSAVDEALDTTIQAFGDVPSLLLNNAALDSPPGSPPEETGPLETYPEASWDKVMDVNVKGTLVPCQAVGGAMAQAGRGSIVNINSIYGILSPDQTIYEYRQRDEGVPFFKPVAYSASKSAVLNLTRYLATYWAKAGVRVNSMTLAGVFNDQDERFMEGYLRRMPVGRMARAEEYNGALVFLASDASVYMTGSNLVIDGGWSAW